MRAARVPIAVSSTKGTYPVSDSKITSDSEYTSARPSRTRPWACSGAE